MLQQLILRNILRNCVNGNNNILQRAVSNTKYDSRITEKWDLYCGICLERKPILSKQLNEVELNFQKLLNELEFENSMKSDHELHSEADKRRADMFKKGKISTEDLDKSLGESATEFEDKSTKEFESFVCTSRTTEADKLHDTKSTQRCLDKHLLFLTNETIGNEKYWILPHGIRNDEGTLRQTAERILNEKCGDINVKYFGNAPCGFYKFKYPKDMRDKDDIIGAKIFYYKVQYMRGEIKTGDIEYCWATRDELKKQLKPGYYKNVKLFLINDEN